MLIMELTEIEGKRLRRFLFESEECDFVEYAKSIKSTAELHYFLWNYNCDDGIEAVRSVVENKFCDFGTALMAFWYLGGTDWLDEKYVKSINLDGHFDQELQLAKDIAGALTSGKYSSCIYRYEPELNKLAKYKLNKAGINECLFEPSDGEEWDRHAV
ncbi:DUF4274 domain-containing protein [Sedimenticola selenatireducens]|uniref:DUF4274 domain-containing protein n=1 Tax=Sedimenticola selenatireducens TaxID=191960 RepID=A0A558DU12_9GAMM|nr:DUF4274 domain-containing protein [Sedimenticola selenatireducens]TVO77089.1 DUF4274 domain-containing protein [Sedimenticola selenatireducens]TVT64532.1 MAG: DUF4274 domain-containing protein [Sedimenticola selenatireducens]